MGRWTRRKFLKTSLAASAGVVANAGLPAPMAGSQQADQVTPPQVPSMRDLTVAFSLRERLLMDFGWRFHFGNADDPAKDFGFGSQNREATFAKSGDFPPVTRVNFDDSAWQAVDLPHDWAVELPFEKGNETFDRNGKPYDPPRYDLPDHGAKPIGRNYPETSIGWYRRVFQIPAEDQGKRIWIEFDGVFRHAMVMLNGHYIGEEFSGYAPFRFDVTDFLNYGDKNALTVRVDATLAEGWFYEGAGIYRHVWLTKMPALHIVPDGVYIRTAAHGDGADVFVSVEVANDSDAPAKCKVFTSITSQGRKPAAVDAHAEEAEISAWSRHTFESRTIIDKPAVWSIESSHIYTALTILTGSFPDCSGKDQSNCYTGEETKFGVRSVRFDANRGFFLNDRPVKIKGTCNHQDHAGVGSALPDRLQYYRVERLKSMGSNAIRTSHNPPTPELLDACDALGMMVMCETRMMSSNPEGLSQLERMIRKCRNHPSIIIWSLGNEEPEQGRPRGARIISSMKRLAKQLDPSRPVTLAMNGGWGQGASAIVDVQGCNYSDGRIDDFHKQFPAQPMMGSETASTVCTRGIYENDKVRGYVSAYDLNFPPWAATAEQWWKDYDSRPFLAGGFAWTGFDYRGEPTPYNWPCISSHFGIMDTCGFPKDNYFYYQAWWGALPVLHLFPHWNWAGKEGQEISVWCHSNLDSVELFVNGASQGAKAVEKNSHVEWKVKYAPGFIEARGTKNGRVVLTEKRETTGASAKIVLKPDRDAIFGNGEDLSCVTVEIQDAQGRAVPTASNEVIFAIDGPGRLIGVGNGDPSCHESDKGAKRSAFNGLCMAFVQSHKAEGEIHVAATSPGLASGSAVIHLQKAEPRPSVS